MSNYSFGLPERDRIVEVLGGGLPHGSLALFEGGNGTGKSVLAQRLAYGMATEGATVAYVSPALRYPEFVDQMNSLSYPLADLVVDERLTFLHADVYDPDTSLEAFTEFSFPWEHDVVVVDGFERFLRNDPRLDHEDVGVDERRAVDEVLGFLSDLKGLDKSVVFVVNPTELDDRLVQPLRSDADVHFEHRVDRSGTDQVMAVDVVKFARSATRVEDTVSFEVLQDRGVSVITRTIA